MFYLSQNGPNYKNWSDTWIFFWEYLPPMSEGDLTIIKMRMFSPDCRRLTIMIHGPKCFSSSNIAQEQKAIATVMISISSLLTIKKKLIPSLLNRHNFFQGGGNLFDYSPRSSRCYFQLNNTPLTTRSIYTVGLLRTTTATGFKTTLSSISRTFNIAWTWWTGSCGMFIGRNSQQCCWQTVQTHTLLVGSSC